MKPLAGLISGLLFGFGLAVAGMTDTNRILGFLDIFGDWQPALMLVMGCAVVVALVGFRFVLRQKKPFFSPSFYLPETSEIDGPLLAGATLFGVGWGLYGYCPGPAVASMIYGDPNTYLFMGAMAAGMWASAILTGAKA